MNKGFSLVELIVVIAIMAILVGVAVPVYTSYITKANENVDKQLADEVDRAITTLLIDQDVTNPTIGEGTSATTVGVTIVLTDGTTGASFAVGSGVTDTDGKFIAELNKLLPNLDLKANTSITFTVGSDGYSVTNTLLDPAAESEDEE